MGRHNWKPILAQKLNFCHTHSVCRCFQEGKVHLEGRVGCQIVCADAFQEGKVHLEGRVGCQNQKLIMYIM